VSDDSQVSVRDTSREFSEMKSCRRQGLFRFSVMEDAERILRQAKEMDLVESVGPGFSSTSPERRMIK